MKIIATSFERYNGGIRAKRLYGSSTITRFYVHLKAEDVSLWEVIEVGGPTPGERKTKAIEKYKRLKGIE